MPATTTLKGGPELRARLNALASSQMKIEMNRAWQDTTVKAARTNAPSRTGAGRSSIAAGWLSDVKAQVRGAFWLIFIDRGTKAHDIRPQSISGSGRHWKTSVQPEGPKAGYGNPPTLAFNRGGKLVFAKKVHKRAQRKRPFITEAAQSALRQHMLRDVVLQTWSQKRAGRWTKWAA